MSRSPDDRKSPSEPARDAPSGADRGEHLSEILTDWKMIRDAHVDAATPSEVEPVRLALRSLWDRYERAIRRYVGRLVPDPQAAEEIYQEFALRVFSGAFRHADPEKGRFRKYLKTALANLVRDHYNKAHKGPATVPADLVDPADDRTPRPSAEADRQFLADWRDALMKASWDRLKSEEKRTGRPHQTALRLCIRHDGEGSAKLAERLSTIVGRPCTAAHFNKQVHNARKQHAFFLIDEVARTLRDDATLPEIEEELIALGLHDYSICRDALREYRMMIRRRDPSPTPIDPGDALGGTGSGASSGMVVDPR